MKATLAASVNTPAISASSPNFLPVSGGGGSSLGSTTEATPRLVCASPFAVKRLYVFLSAAPGVGTSWTITLRRNGADTAITGTIADAATSCDLSGSVSFADSDTIDVSITGTNTPALPTTTKLFAEVSAANAFPLLGGQNTSVSNSASVYLGLLGWDSGSGETTEAAAQQIVPIAGYLRNLRLTLSGSPGGSASYTAIVYQNGSPTGVTVAVSAAGTTALTTQSLRVAAGDTLSVQITPSGTPTARIIKLGCEFVPDTDGQSFLCYGSSLAPSTSVQSYQAPGQGTGTWSSTESLRSVPVPSGYTITALYAVVGTASGAAKSWDAIFRDGGSSVVTVNLANTTSGSSTGLSTAIAADKDLVAFSFLPHSTPAAMTGGGRIAIALSGPVTTKVTGLPSAAVI